MSLAPRASDLPRIPGALRAYRIAAYVTGVLLLLVVAEMVLKYALRLEVYAFGGNGVIAVLPVGSAAGLNVSTGLLIVHGWFYVVYLFVCFRLWSFMRWGFGRFITLASGGIVPALSFVLETRYVRLVRAQLAAWVEPA